MWRTGNCVRSCGLAASERRITSESGAGSYTGPVTDSPDVAPATPQAPVPTSSSAAPAAVRADVAATTPEAAGVGRFAPSPTGDFHVGNLRTALLAWIWARRTGRAFVLRLEDIDRVRSGSADRQLADLEAIGVEWDGAPLVQSTRYGAHADALRDLDERGLVFECYCSRRDIREAGSAPHVPPGHYPGTCLDLTDAERELRRTAVAREHRSPAVRLRAPAATWTVHDELHGEFTGPVDHFVVRRADGAPAYNLAAVVDDGFQGIDQVVRGDDLLGQAPAQAALATLLGLPVPTYVHVPLALAPTGARLAKRDGAVTLADLRALGWETADVVEWIGRSLGVESASTGADLLDALDLPALRALPLDPWIVEPPTDRPSRTR